MILFFTVFQQFRYHVSHYGSLWVHPTWNPLSFLDIYSYSFLQIWGDFSHFFPPSILFFLSYTPVWDFHNAYVSPLVGVLQVFKLCLLFFTRFVCCFSDLIIFTLLFSSLLILFSVHPNLTLNNPSGFFFFYISHFTFSSKFLFAPLWFLLLYWYFSQFHFISYNIFLTFSVLSFSCSDVFKIVI